MDLEVNIIMDGKMHIWANATQNASIYGRPANISTLLGHPAEYTWYDYEPALHIA